MQKSIFVRAIDKIKNPIPMAFVSNNLQVLDDNKQFAVLENGLGLKGEAVYSNRDFFSAHSKSRLVKTGLQRVSTDLAGNFFPKLQWTEQLASMPSADMSGNEQALMNGQATDLGGEGGTRFNLQMTIRRIVDLLIATVTLVVASPIMIIAAFAIFRERGWSVKDIFFRHERIGLNGRRFNCLKFQTMVKNVDEVREKHFKDCPGDKRRWETMGKLDDDPAITSFGKMLRKTSIDELPQLFNVLRGDMSIIGPRPVTQKELDEQYGIHTRQYTRVRPGITGLWQVSGRNNLTYRERVRLDCYYVRNWSFRLDAWILLRTIPAVLRTDQTS